MSGTKCPRKCTKRSRYITQRTNFPLYDSVTLLSGSSILQKFAKFTVSAMLALQRAIRLVLTLAFIYFITSVKYIDSDGNIILLNVLSFDKLIN